MSTSFVTQSTAIVASRATNMSKATRATPAEYRDDPDAVSLHTTPDEYEYHDALEISGSPPSYADSEAGSAAAGVPIRHVTPPTTRTNHDSPSFTGGKPNVCET